jgi:hypothetical protein
MLRRLHKLASTSARLRRLSVEKQAGLNPIPAINSAASAPIRAVGRWASKNKLTAAGVGLGAVAAPAMASGTYKKHKAGFDPAVSSVKMGLPPPQ